VVRAAIWGFVCLDGLHQELEMLLCGLSEIDVQAWRASAAYRSCTGSEEQIVWFWNVRACTCLLLSCC